MGRWLTWVSHQRLTGWACSACGWTFPVPSLLTDPDAKSSDIESITDQQITNARNELPNSAALATNIAGLGGTPLGDGHTAAEVAGSAIAQVAADNVEPAVIDYMRDPASKWNHNGGKDRPTEGNAPTHGVLVCHP